MLAEDLLLPKQVCLCPETPLATRSAVGCSVPQLVLS